MIEIVERRELILSFPEIASEIAKLQESFHDEENLEWYKEQDKEHSYWEMYDLMEATRIERTRIDKVVGHHHSDINTFVDDLSKDLSHLFERVGAEEFILISHLRLDVFGTLNTDYLPLKKAHERLASFIHASSFNEALKFTKINLAEIMGVFFWITRCDPTAPEYIFIADSKGRFMFNICKYGNIHLTEFGSELFPYSVLKNFGFKLIDGYEIDNFSDDGVLEGRSIID